MLGGLEASAASASPAAGGTAVTSSRSRRFSSNPEPSARRRRCSGGTSADITSADHPGSCAALLDALGSEERHVWIRPRYRFCSPLRRWSPRFRRGGPEVRPYRLTASSLCAGGPPNRTSPGWTRGPQRRGLSEPAQRIRAISHCGSWSGRAATGTGRETARRSGSTSRRLTGTGRLVLFLGGPQGGQGARGEARVRVRRALGLGDLSAASSLLERALSTREPDDLDRWGWRPTSNGAHGARSFDEAMASCAKQCRPRVGRRCAPSAKHCSSSAMSSSTWDGDK